MQTGQIIKGYRLVRRLGEESPYQLYEGEAPGKAVELKLMVGESASGRCEQFLRAAQALSTVSHHALCPIEEWGALPDGTGYLVRPRIGKGRLSSMLQAGRPMGLASLGLLIPLAEALSALHQAGYGYFGLCPGRIALFGEGAELVPVLLDCEDIRKVPGVSPFAETLREGTLKDGTDPLLYMAPERLLRSEEIDGKADVYALGAIVYHMLCGHPPHNEGRAADVISGHLQRAPAPLRQSCPEASEDLARLIHSMLARSPQRRPPLLQVIEELSLHPRGPARSSAGTPRRLGDYDIVRKIAEGGMGVVYEGYNPVTKRRAAIKVMKKELLRSPELKERFVREVHAANALATHPGVVTVLQTQVQEEDTFMVMEYLNGATLRSKLGRDPMDPQSVIRIGWQLALAMAEAHQRGVVHRDLKPDNIMLVPESSIAGGLRTKILDFGIAKLDLKYGRQGFPTVQGAMLGTPNYMAPEQRLNAANVTERADVFALGVILDEMLVGKYRATRQRLQPPVDQRLADLVEKMTRENPEERPDMRNIAQELKRMGGDKPEHAWRESVAPLALGLAISAIGIVGLFLHLLHLRGNS